MAKLMCFFEGGLSYTEASRMPLDEFFALIDCANTIATQRKNEMEQARGK
jgi:hypothetical protein